MSADAVKCDHEWELKDNDGHVREYHCPKCDKTVYQEEAHAG